MPAPKYQGPYITGQKVVRNSAVSGDVVVNDFHVTVPTGLALAIGDIIEIGILPAFHRVVDAKVIQFDSMGAGATLDVGIMTGTVADSSDTTRTCGNELFAAAPAATFTPLQKADALLVVPANVDRSIGIKIGGAAVTGANQVVRVLTSLAYD